MRIWSGLAMAISLAAITAGGIIVSNDNPPPAAGTANMWVVQGGGSCTRSSTAVSYSASASPDARCGALDTAYQAAACGDDVIITSAGGDFTSTQSFAYRSALASCGEGNEISYTVAEGETVEFTSSSRPGIEVCGANHISIVSPDPDNFQVGANLSIHPCSDGSREPHNITITGIDFGVHGDDGDYYIDSLQEGLISHNDFGPEFTAVGDAHESKFWCNTNNAAINTDITFEYNYIHDITSDGDAHNSGGLVSYLWNSTLRGNKFARVVSEDWLVKPDGSGQGSCNTQGDQIRDLTFENNWFAAPCASGCGHNPDFGLSFHNRDGNAPGTAGSPFDTFIIRNNSLNSAITFNNADGTTFDSNSRFYGNVLPKGGECMQGGTTEYNMYFGSSGSTCGTNAATQTGNPYANSSSLPGVFDYHLSGSSGSTSADNLVPTGITGGCPAKDIDEQTRPIDSNCDAGSDER